MGDTSRDQMLKAIRAWTTNLDNYPGWKEWRRRRFGHTLHFDDQFSTAFEKLEDEFHFSDEMEKHHAVVIQYIGLHDTIISLKECEYYFRRYPFWDLPVTRHSHITNVCEMYFGRFYEFKERLRNYFDAVTAATPRHGLDVGGFIKTFNKVFDQELRARHGIHHHRRFGDVAIDQVLLTESLSEIHPEKGWKREHLTAYRKLSRQWARRVRLRGAKMDEFLEAIAVATLATCNFLSALLPPNQESSPVDSLE